MAIRAAQSYLEDAENLLAIAAEQLLLTFINKPNPEIPDRMQVIVNLANTNIRMANEIRKQEIFKRREAPEPGDPKF